MLLLLLMILLVIVLLLLVVMERGDRLVVEGVVDEAFVEGLALVKTLLVSVEDMLVVVVVVQGLHRRLNVK